MVTHVPPSCYGLRLTWVPSLMIAPPNSKREGVHNVTCYHPLKAYNLINQSTPAGKAKIVFSDKLVQGKEYELIDLPCSQCIGCRMDKSKEWAVRCMHESELYSVSTVVTLTIDDEHLPEWKSLDKAYFRNFMKRLRKSKKGVDAVEHNGKLIWPIRYFQCGEYGDDLDRPHHHAILFNCEFEDKEDHRSRYKAIP